ncbi:MAG TPA: nucleoside kinase [Candidatus Cloacimonadota bacterium]|nr:nucleoside kinase [Candidatus Cloacimonadota bacterium]
MIQIEITHQNKHLKTLTFSNPTTINEIMKDLSFPFCKIVAYKINNLFVNGTSRIEHNTKIEIVPFNTPVGYRIYQDSVIFLMHMAFYHLLDTKIIVNVEHSIGDGVYCELVNSPDKIDDADLKAIGDQMMRICEGRIPIESLTVSIDEAEKYFTYFKRFDILKNISYGYGRNIDIFRCDNYYDYYPRPLVPHTGLLDSFELSKYGEGFILRFPKKETCQLEEKFEMPKLLFGAHQEHDKWLQILKVQNIGDLNKLVENYKISEFIQVEEALQEKKIAFLADQIHVRKKAKVVLIAGPSSSGKTTFAKRLAVQLRVNGLSPIVMGLDDYFLPRSLTPRLENGEYDFESIRSLDLPFLNEHLLALLNGEEITLPRYNFINGTRESSNEKIKLNDENVLVIEGIHGINDMLSASIPAENKIKIYISALNQLNIDYHNRIATTDCRKIRRIARDYRYRGYSAEETLTRWESVRAGEDKNIFPYQENVDFMFNSSLTYEMGVLKKYVLPQLKSISQFSEVYNDALYLIALLEHMKDIQDELVPTNSLLREFTYGSVFKY